MRRFLTSLPLRYSALAISAVVLCISLYSFVTVGKGLWWLIAAALLVLLGLWDMAQKHHAILRNYPIMGHFRFFFNTSSRAIPRPNPFLAPSARWSISAPRARWTTAPLARSWM